MSSRNGVQEKKMHWEKNMCSDVWIAVRYGQVGVVRMRVMHET